MLLGQIFTPMNITLMILLGSAIFFMRGKVRSDLVAMCALLLLVITNILTPAQALSGFSNSVVIMMVGLFVVGGGIFRTGLAKLVSSKILGLAGNSETKLFFLVMLVTASIGAFVSNTGTVAVMMPIVVSIAVSANQSPRKFLMPLAFASSMGMFTLISTPPNLVISEELQKNGFDALSFFSFAPIGFISLTVGVVVLFFLRKIFLSNEVKVTNESSGGKTLDDLADEYKLHNLTRILVSDNSPIAGKELRELRIPSEYNISVVSVEKKINGSSRFGKDFEEQVAGPNTKVDKGDILVCYGKDENIEQFVEKNTLKIVKEVINKKSDIFDFEEIGIAEVFIMPSSKLVNRTIVDAHFRDEYNVNILGIQRNNEYMLSGLQKEKLHSGDALLIQGTWSNIANLGNRQSDLVLVGQPLKEAAKVTLDYKAPLAAIIMLLMVVAMVTNIVAPVIAVLLAAVFMVVTGCLRNMEEAYNTINWESIVLIAAMMPMAIAFEETGAATMISGSLVSGFGQYGPYALLAGVYFGTSVLTMFISNTATAVLFAPIGMQAAVNMGVSPYPFMFAVAVAASMCFASPFSTAPNALVMSAGRYTFMDYIKVGLPLQIIMGIVMIIMLPLLFPF